jgi:hypothetical protein
LPYLVLRVRTILPSDRDPNLWEPISTPFKRKSVWNAHLKTSALSMGNKVN